MRDTGWSTIVVTLACCLVLSGSVVAVTSTDGRSLSAEDRFAQEIDADAVVMQPTLDADGDANWRVVYRLRLDSDERKQAFEELEAEVETNESAYLDPFTERIRRTVENARSTTGREMTAGNFSVTAERTSQPDATFGEVTFQFTWDGFAAVDGQEIRAGDALDRLVLDEDTSLQVRWPAAYTLVSHTPEAPTVENERVIWRGPIDFDTGEPRVVVSTADGATPGGGTGDDSTDSDGGSPPASESGSSLLPWAAALVIVLVGVVAGWVVFSRREHAEPTDTASGSEDTDGPPPELLSNEERVLQLLDQHGGRMKQKQVAEELDWTAAKTSQVVGDLRDDDEIEAFRLGRENVLTLPDVDITDDGEE